MLRAPTLAAPVYHTWPHPSEPAPRRRGTTRPPNPPSTPTPTPPARPPWHGPPTHRSVAIGSSTQIALFVAPFCVLVGWIMGQPLSLDFQLFETATLVLTVLMVNFIIIDGRANWMIGLLLVAGYAIVALSFAMHGGSGV